MNTWQYFLKRETKICPVCGTENAKSAKKCKNCGANIANVK